MLRRTVILPTVPEVAELKRAFDKMAPSLRTSVLTKVSAKGVDLSRAFSEGGASDLTRSQREIAGVILQENGAVFLTR